MARFLCQLCYNVVNYGEKHPCFYYKNDENVYSLPELFCTGNPDQNKEKSKDRSLKKSNDDSGFLTQSAQQSISKKIEPINVSLFQNNGKDRLQPSRRKLHTVSEGSSNSAQKMISCDISCFNHSSSVQVTEVKFKEDASFTELTSSGNVTSWYKPKNDFHEANNISPTVMDSNCIEDEKQRVSGIPNLIHATDGDQGEISRQENICKSLNNEKMNLVVSSQCVIRTDHLDNSKVPALRNQLANSDFPLRSDEHSKLYNKSENSDTYVKKRISSETDSSAAAGSSGLCPLKNKFQCSFCPKILTRQFNLDDHHRTHTGERPFVCPFCDKAFSTKGYHKTHIRTHTGERPYKCPVCGMAFTTSGACRRHRMLHV